MSKKSSTFAALNKKCPKTGDFEGDLGKQNVGKWLLAVVFIGYALGDEADAWCYILVGCAGSWGSAVMARAVLL